MSGSWEPILAGQAADAARQAVGEIATPLAALTSSRDEAVDRAVFAAALAEYTYGSPSSNAVEQALFFDYRARVADDAEAERDVERALEQMAQAIDLGFASDRLYGGLTGAGWVAAHISGGKGASDEELGEEESSSDEFLTSVDRAIVDRLAASPWTGDYDLIGGLCGLGVYLLERLEQAPEVAGDGLAHIVRHLGERSEAGMPGLTWRTAPEMFSARQRALFPDGYYNLGMAHGVPGVIALLGRIADSQADSPRVRELLRGAVEWTLAQRGPASNEGRFPTSMLGPGKPTSGGSRAAWCYGDPGIAVALFGAARRTGEAGWEAEAMTLALECATRRESSCGVVDAGLCHGAAGLAHLFNRLYQASREPAFREAAVRWIARALAMREPGKGVGGFAAFRPASDGEDARWVAATGFLEGAAGIGLALLATFEPVEPNWDRLLLCDLPLGTLSLSS